MKKIPLIEYKKNIQNKDLRKLFNIVVNYYQLNNPKDVGFCVKIYSEYFESHKKWDFNEAIDFYTNYIGIEKSNIIKNNLKDVGVLSNELIQLILKEKINITENKTLNREEQYENILNKTFSIFYKGSASEAIYDMKAFANRLLKYSKEEIASFGKQYLISLLTIDSMIGTIIETDILKYFSKKYLVFKSNNYLERLDIDGVINKNYVSIKSVNYRNSAYKRVAGRNINKIIQGPIIYYRIIGDMYRIDNLEEVEKFLSKEGSVKFKNLKKIS
jgi:hypothetical protein